MGQARHTLTGLPAEGEKYMTTGDLREWEERLRAFRDDGSAVVRVKLGRGGRVRQITATIAPPDPAATAWDALLADARTPGTALAARFDGPGTVERRPDEGDADTLTGIPALQVDAATGQARARLNPRREHGAHARQ